MCIESRATAPSGEPSTTSFTYAINQTVSSENMCNYGDVEYEVQVSASNVVTTDAYFHYADFSKKVPFLVSSSDIYAYKVDFAFSNTSSVGSMRNIYAHFVYGTVDDFFSENLTGIADLGLKNRDTSLWIVSDYSVSTYYFSTLSYVHTYMVGTSSSSAKIVVTSDVDVTITPYTQTGYLQEIADNSKETNEKLEETNETLKDTNETTKGIFSSITEFFGSFFQNLIDSVIGLFVPSAEEMSDLFGQLNDFFSDRFGFLYAPFDYMIQLMQVFTSSTGSTGLTFPGFSIMGYEVWPDMTYDLASDPLVSMICGYVRTGTGILLSGYFIMFLQQFFKERFGNG